MKRLIPVFSMILALCLLAACGSDEPTSESNQSPEAAAVTEAVGGPFTEAEFEKFLKDLPSMPGMTAASQQAMADGAEAALPAAIKAKAKELGWSEDRFMYMYGHSMAVLSVEQLGDMQKQMREQMADMPEAQKQMMEQMLSQQTGEQMDAIKAEMDKQVPASEQTIIRDNMDALCSAMGIPKP
ncbi:hypothetical protein GM415_02915 [Pseudodesulfovibrio cashew]|uniref:DUF305 domain-containing protein n=1 Tax=Pseudodesulfovibrio cashew TaxID=2678688 RepID=A0A6I6JDM1_9BACT|nr:hypothetical protein [Pseudodesulfovibrio cashew]QGY39118.1 hypothetical protein GM415_02915 [Pseudodesulfovibrio cashew]